ncbi:hypothetical protein BV25DRAFT_1990235 [Artomyces pyxidatus]|uniref:Uncharacterized protein n=1 Tax=Artomyces pyxidatus TaxID=48021 RepID=A0ACB8T5C6_9AGAM|nr:hypothetical protein BV25DRAFT_1990235 [Artomyces pyxidatus]
MDGGLDTVGRPHASDDTAVDVDSDADTCRICSAPAEPGQPLFYPCKCSGTIRYIHQDCLTTWLAHSKKKTCDVCKYPYSFTKVYAEDMPKHLPLVLLFRRSAQHGLFAILFCIRAVVVSFVWLAILPWITVWTWRMYFAMGNSTAFWISARPRPTSTSSLFFYNLTSRSRTPSSNTTIADAFPSAVANRTDSSPLNHFISHPLLRSISADIFTGQIIATLIVLVFIAVFLLREWISQNARPGVFEDGDMAGAAGAAEMEREQELQRERDREALQQRERDLMRDRQILRERQAQMRRMRQQLRDLERQRRAKEREVRELERAQHSRQQPEQGQLRHPHRPMKDLPSRPPSARARANAENGHPSSANQPVDTARPTPHSLTLSGDDVRTARMQEMTRRQAEWRREHPWEARLGEPKPYQRVRRTLSPSSFPGKGKEKADATRMDPITSLLQKRIDAGVLEADNWQLYDFEMFEMDRLGISRMFASESKAAERDPRELFWEAENAAKAERDKTTSTAQFGDETVLGLSVQKTATRIPDDWTEWLGPATDDARRWRARRRVLYDRWQDEAYNDELGVIDVPQELADVRLEDMMLKSYGERTPPPEQKPSNRTFDIPGSIPAQDALKNHHRWAGSNRAHPLRVVNRMDGEVPAPLPEEVPAEPRPLRRYLRIKLDDPTATPFSFANHGVAPKDFFEPKAPSPLPYPIAPSSASTSSPSSSQSLLPHSAPTGPPSAVGIPRRPPMPTATLPTPTTPPVPLRNKESTPLGSPSLATYRPPEEFQDEIAGYFDTVMEETDARPEDFEEEHAIYFRDPEANDEVDLQTDEDGDEVEEAQPLVLLTDSEAEDVEDVAVGNGVEDDPQGAVWAPEWEEEDLEPGAEMDDAVEGEGDGEEEGEAGAEEVDDGAMAAQIAEDEIGVEDDMEGALEAIGLRGPLYVVAQNAALMIFVLDTAIGLGVWLPFTFGKSTALLSLDPKRALQVLHWPIKLMRVITDPIVDSALFLIGRVLLPSALTFAKFVLLATLWLLGALASKVIGRHALDKATEYYWAVHANITRQPWGKARDFMMSRVSSVLAPAPVPSPSPSLLDRFFDLDHPVVRFAEPHFAVLGQQVRLSSDSFKQGWMRMALGDGNSERVFAVCLGYAVIGLLLAFYLNVLTVGTVKSAGRAVRSAVRQQLLVIKVATFIVIELILFPLGCGINLDLCSIWLFPEASLHSRLMFFKYAPLTATFYHWVIGTMFMYQFAILLAGCRTIMRPGAMWFIKDPSDQNFHPIRDILERPALIQLRKLSVSAIMYGLVVAFGVGSIGGIMRVSSGAILPLRWKPREPLSDIPLDLLFLHIMLPYTVHFFRPRKAIRRASIQVWRYLCARLRLTSYMFGELHPEEEFTPQQTNWFRKVEEKSSDAAQPSFDGSYRRVPASDNVVIPRDMRATAEVDAQGNPANEEAGVLIAAQNTEAERAKRNANEDYTVVYIPPHFRYRIAAFIIALWVIGCVFIAVALSTPIHLGRQIFKLFTEKEVHDGYSFLVGFYSLWACWTIGYAVDHLDRRRQRQSSDEPRAKFPLFLAKRSFLWLAKVTYMAFFLGVVMPILIALVVEVYMVLPIRLTLDPNLVPRIRIVDMWALGIIYAKIALQAHNMRPHDHLTAGIRNIQLHGWTNPDPIQATTEVIIPLLAGLIGMLVLPPFAVTVFRRFVPLRLEDRYILMHVYPSIFAAAGFARMVVAVAGVLSSWSQGIRDKEFLVEMRLRNYEQERVAKKAEAEQVKAAEGEAEGNGPWGAD